MSLVTTPVRELAVCARCAGPRVTAITMTLTDGSVVDFASCHGCEHKTWRQAGRRPRHLDRAHQGQEAQAAGLSRHVGSLRVRDLSSIVKAYDVRGIVPDQFDALTARALGAAFARFAGAPRIVVARDMRESGVELGRAFAEGATRHGRRRGRRRPRLDRPAVLRGRHARGARRDVHREPQPGPLQRHQAVPGRAPARSGRTPASRRSAATPRRFLAEGLPASGRTGTLTTQDLLADYAAHLQALVPGLDGIRPLKVVVDGGNGMGGLTVPVVLRAACRSRSSRCTSSSTARSPTTRPTRSTRPTLVDLQARVVAEGADLGPGLRRRRRPLLRRRRARRARQPLGADRADRRARAAPRAGQHGDPQPHHQPGGARGRDARPAARRCAPGSATRSSRPRWPAPARSSAASTPATSTSATSGTPTPACSPRCTPSPRSARTTARCRRC